MPPEAAREVGGRWATVPSASVRHRGHVDGGRRRIHNGILMASRTIVNRETHPPGVRHRELHDGPHVLRDLTSFIGRETDLARLSSLFEADARLVTIHGPPGMGKTRLAHHWLLEADGGSRASFFCDLRSARSVQDLALEVGRALQVRLDNASTSSRIVESIGQILAARGSCILVLDNFEQLAPVAARTVAQWMCDASQTRFLVTSRRRLGLKAEQIHELRPLRLPSSDADWNCESMELFAARAKAVAPWFDRHAVQVEPVVELVRRFEGVPLALELAAGQMKRRTPAELLQLVEHRAARCIERIHQDADPRHATLDTALMGSWELLDSTEQQALARLAVFRGGFDLAAAEAVLSPARVPPPRATIDVIEDLCDAALLVRSGTDETARWDMYESVRDFARARASFDVEALRGCYAAYWLEAGETWAASLNSHEGLHARRALRRESGNLQHAFTILSEADDGDSRQQLGRLALVLHASLRESMPALAMAPLCEALAKTLQRKRVDRRRKAKLLLARANVTTRTENYPAALEDLRAARNLAQGDDELLARIDLEVAGTYHCVGSLSLARQSLHDSLDAARAVRSDALEGRIHTAIAWLLAEGFADPRGFTHYRKAVMLTASCGDLVGESFARVGRCGHRIFFARGNPKNELQALVETAERNQDSLLRAYALSALGIGALDDSCLDEAKDWLDQAIVVAERCGMKRDLGIYTGWLAMVMEEGGQRWDAIAHYESAIRLLNDIGDLRSVERHRVLLAGALASDGDLEGGRELIRNARLALNESEDSNLADLVAIVEGRLSLARRNTLASEGSMKEARSHLLAAGKAKDSVRPKILGASPRLRSQLRLFERQARAFSDQPILRVWPEGAAFQLGSQSVVDLPSGPSKALRRVLWALAEHRRERPGHPMSVARLVAAGWPGERILPRAASMRVRNAVLRLRRAGLVGVLRTDSDGYALDASVPLEMPT